MNSSVILFLELGWRSRHSGAAFCRSVFWADWVDRHKAGLLAIPRDQLSVERLTEAVARALSEGRLRAHAAALGAKIRREQGEERAVQISSGLVGKVRDGEGSSLRPIDLFKQLLSALNSFGQFSLLVLLHCQHTLLAGSLPVL